MSGPARCTPLAAPPGLSVGAHPAEAGAPRTARARDALPRLLFCAAIPSAGPAAAAPVELPALGLQIDLPTGWIRVDAAPDGLRAAGPDGAALLIWASPGQLRPTATDAGALARLHEAALRAELDDPALQVEPVRTATPPIAGAPSLRADLALRAGEQRGRARAWVFPGDGITVHARVLAGEAAGDRPAAAIEAALATAALRPGPAPLPAPRLELPGLAEAALPAGWRPPLPAERGAVEDQLGALGLALGPGCGSALTVSFLDPIGVLLACPVDLPLGPLGGAAAPAVAADAEAALGLPPGSLQPAPAGGRPGLRAAPDPGVGVLVVPAREGALVVWAAAAAPGAAAAALDAVAPALAWHGADGAAHRPPLRARLRALPVPSPAVTVAAALALLLGALAVRRRRRRAPAGA